MIITAEIKGNKYSEYDLDNMLTDYLTIGENVRMLRKQKVEELFRKFVEKYSRNGIPIITKEKYKKQFINSAKELYQMAEFYFCKKAEAFLEDYRTYHLSKNLKGARVFLYFKEDACIGLVYDSIPNFLLEWFIVRRVLEVEL